MKNFAAIAFTVLLSSLFVYATPATPCILGQAQTLTGHTVTTEHVSFTYFIPCANGGLGEDVTVSGPLHSDIYLRLDEAVVNGFYVFNAAGLVGVADSTGNVYREVGVTRESFTNLVFGESGAFHYVNNFQLVGQGTAENYLVHTNMTFTVANGQVTSVQHDNFIVECR